MENFPVSDNDPNILPIKQLIQKGSYLKAIKEIETTHVIEYVDQLILKSKIYELNGNFEYSLELATLAHIECKNKKSFKHELASTVCIAYAFWRLNKFQDALTVLSEKERILNDLDQQDKQSIKEEEASLYNIKGLILWKINQLDFALENLQKGLLLREELQNDHDISYSLNNIGNVYLKQDRLDKAYDYYQNSLKIRKKLRNIPAIAASYNSLARYYEQMHNYSQALSYYKKSLQLWKKVNNKQFIAKSFRFIGSNYQLQNDNKLALKYYYKSLDLFKEIGNNTDFGITKQLIENLKISRHDI